MKMLRVAAMLSALAVLMVAPLGAAGAAESCHRINAKGVGNVAEAQPGDPDGLTRTLAQIRGGGLLQGTTEAAFFDVGGVFPVLAFEGPITFTTSRSTLTADLEGTLDVSVGEFQASGEVTGATGKLEGAQGSLTLVGALGDAGSFTEQVTGEICVDLSGNGNA